jgi:holo-ACP synthase
VASGDLTRVLGGILRGRDERAFLQNFLFRSVKGVGSLLQISLNIPGFPKRLPNDEAALSKALDMVKLFFDSPPLVQISLSSQAGVSTLLALGRGEDPVGVKMAAVGIEEGCEWGRALDLDVMTEDGAVSRSRLGLTPRRCLICGGDAKVCARQGRHEYSELRGMVCLLLEKAGRG